MTRRTDLEAAFERPAATHASAEYRDDEAGQIMTRKNFAATGSFIAEDRPRALDLLGFSSQLVFNTFHNRRLHDWEHARRPRPGLRGGPGPQPGHGRVLLGRPPPPAHLLRAPGRLRPGRGDGRRGHRRWGRPPCWWRRVARPAHSPSHLGLDPVWARAQEAGRARRLPRRRNRGPDRPRTTSATACRCPPDFHGGEENFRSVDYMGIPGPPAQTLATMIFDGVLERFPALRIGVIEQGAIWVPSWTRQMEAAFDAFARHEERLRALSPAADRLRPPPGPVHAVPHRGRRVGSSTRAAPRSAMFSSDYPHVEGGRRPLEHFEASLAGTDEEARQRFYVDNFLDLLGAAAAPLAA